MLNPYCSACAGVFYRHGTPMQRSKQQLQILFQPEETVPSPAPEVRARSIELLSLMLLEVIRKRRATNEEEGNERKDSNDASRT
jgi:hypothetical protein